MEQMTLGQRIAERRKMLGLSQEGLGEKLGVSRQAISKWESDGAVPEIDKLITLSRLFSVSVGWLLGVEEQSSPSQNDGLTDEQLKMVEEIVRRYQQPAQETTKSPRSKILAAACVCCAAAALVVSLISLNNTNTQLPDYRDQLNQLSYANSSIQSQLGAVSDRINQLMEGEQLLSENSTALTALPDWETVRVSFHGVPRKWQEGDVAYISLRTGGKEVVKADCAWDGTAYTAQLDVTATEGYESYFVVCHADGTQEQQDVSSDDLTNLKSYMTAYCDVMSFSYETEGSCDEENTIVIRYMDVSLYAPSLIMAQNKEPEWKLVDAVLYCDDWEVGRLSMLEKKPGETGEKSVSAPFDRFGDMIMVSLNNKEFTVPAMDADAQLELRIEAELENGYPMTYCYMVFEQQGNAWLGAQKVNELE